MATANPNLAVKLLIIFLDGFRWDYVYRDNLMGFDLLRQEGVHAEYNEPIFPSLTYPNVMAMTTGLYAENHGLLMNFMHDTEYDNYFDLPLDASKVNGTNWWKDIEPIWVTSTKSGLRTMMYQWPGCNADFSIKPTFCDPYNGAIGTYQLRTGMNDIIDKFQTDQADVGFLYCELTDMVGHVFGPSEMAERGSLHAVDNVIGEMLQKIKNKRMEEKINVIIVSDHGMTQVGDEYTTNIMLEDIIDVKDVDTIFEFGAVTGVNPKKETFQKVYNALKAVEHVHVWKADDIPEGLHFKNYKTRVPEILVVAKKGYYVVGITNNEKQRPYNPAPFGLNIITIGQHGVHGYIPSEVEDMRGIFLAWGAEFKKNVQIPAIRSVDVYNLLMRLIHLDARPNNGSTSVIFGALKENTNDGLKSAQAGNHLIIFTIFFTLFWLF